MPNKMTAILNQAGKAAVDDCNKQMLCSDVDFLFAGSMIWCLSATSWQDVAAWADSIETKAINIDQISVLRQGSGQSQWLA